MLGRRIAARQPPPTCIPELRRALLDEWCNIPQDQIDNLILSMPRRYVVGSVACPPRKPKVASLILAKVDRFPGCENRRHVCHMIMCHVRDPLRINLAMLNGRGDELVVGVVESWVRVLVPLKTQYAEKMMHVKSILAQNSLIDVRYQLACRPCNLTEIQNCEIHRL
ncbi:DDE_3 domain-containing protein [Trichonephila clavipes]|nr:DDE_3 domain-containing protein [Trichonephila clavipes]